MTKINSIRILGLLTVGQGQGNTIIILIFISFELNTQF